MPNLSVIIPTYKRASILQKCLEYIAAQTIADELEVIVVSDGHDAATASLLQNTQSSAHSQVQFYEIPKSHQGVARNVGAQAAESPLCLFIGDDIFLEPDVCEIHTKTHAGFTNSVLEMRAAVLGFTTWDPIVPFTPVMQWLEESGWQFGYPKIEQYAQRCLPKKIQHKFTYTSHISVPTHIALEHPFREDVHMYGWEDIEWGERLAAANIQLWYEPTATAWHHHSLTLEESLIRMEKLGKALQQFRQSERYPSVFKQWMYRLCILMNPKSLDSQHRRAFLKGLQLS